MKPWSVRILAVGGSLLLVCGYLAFRYRVIAAQGSAPAPVATAAVTAAEPAVAPTVQAAQPPDPEKEPVFFGGSKSAPMIQPGDLQPSATGVEPQPPAREQPAVDE